MTLINILVSKTESNAGILSSTWFIVLLSILIGIGFAISIGALIYTYFYNPTSSFLHHQNFNKRIVTLDFNAKTIYIVDSREKENARKESYAKFLKSYSSIDARKLDIFFQEALEGKHAIHSFQVVDVFFSVDGRKKPHKNLIVIDFIDREKKILHFTSTILTNLTKFERREKKNKVHYRGFLTYDKYLFGFRGILSRANQAVFYLIMLVPTRNNGSSEASIEPALYELMDSLCLLIKKDRYIVKIDNNSFLFIDLNKLDPNDIEKLGEKLLYDSNSFLSLKSLKEDIDVTIGVTTRKRNELIQPLKKYTDDARNAALAAYSSPVEVPNISLSDSSALDNNSKKYSDSINRILKNKTWLVYFLPFFDLKESSLSNTYLFNMSTFGEKNLLAKEFLIDTLAKGSIDIALKEIQDDIHDRVVSSGKQKVKIILPIPYQLFHAAVNFFSKNADSSFDICLGFLHSDNSHFDSSGLAEDLAVLKKSKIKSLLFFQKLFIPLFPTEILEQFDGFVLFVDPLKRNSEVNEGRIRFYSMLNYLSPMNKDILVYGVDSLEEVELVADRNVKEVTCFELCNWSSRIETISLDDFEDFDKYILPYPESQ